MQTKITRVNKRKDKLRFCDCEWNRVKLRKWTLLQTECKIRRSFVFEESANFRRWKSCCFVVMNWVLFLDCCVCLATFDYVSDCADNFQSQLHAERWFRSVRHYFRLLSLLLHLFSHCFFFCFLFLNLLLNFTTSVLLVK